MNTENTQIVKDWIKDLQTTLKALKNADEFRGLRIEYVKRAKKTDGYWYDCRLSYKDKLTELSEQIKVCKFILRLTITDTCYGKSDELKFKDWCSTWSSKDFFSIVEVPLSEILKEDLKTIEMYLYDTGQRGLGSKPHIITIR